ncbi:immunoglobulin-like domain-containing protein, partial [Terrisporobacter sp.]|uniref:immunoglobulin-like domain-containing protein n=1 Tax=Terrisporobacter sp. TaxID=1965305 RepID=UPI002A8390DC
MKKVNTKTKVIALSTAAVMTTAIYLKSDNVTNAEQYAKITDNAIELNVDKQDRDTIKLSLSNFSDLAKSLQLSVKIEGNAIFEESNIKWSDTLQNAKTNIKISQDKKALDIFIISSEAINIDGGIIDICEIDVAKEVSSSKEKYKVVPNADANGVAYNYVIDTTNKQVKGSDIKTYSDEALSINNAPTLKLKDMPSIVEGKIILQKGQVFNPKEYVEAIDDEDGTLSVDRIEYKSNVDNKNIGSYTVTYNAKDSDEDMCELVVTVIVEDVKGQASNPVINVLNDTIQIKVGEEVDLFEGITAVDYLGRTLKLKVSDVPKDLTKVGTYTLTYTATDALGNTATVTRKLVVNKPDSPVINGVISTVTINQGDSFDPKAGVTAVDYLGNEIELKITGHYDVNTPGEYIIKYNAEDSYGTKALELQTKLIVKAVSKPVITFASDVINTKVGEAIDLLDGVTAVDYSGNSLVIKVSDTHDFNKDGKYEITYTVTDKFGNTVTATRTLVVNKQNAPIIEGVRSEVIINQGENFDPKEGVKAIDYSGKEIELKITGHYDVNTPGEYIIKYNAEDSYGTKALELQTKLIVKEIVENLPEDNRPDDSITEEKFEIPNEIKDLIDIDVVTPLNGNGTSNNPLLLEVKKVSESTLNNFLNTFKDFNFTVSKITELDGKTQFDIILSKKKSLFNLRAVDDIHISILVNNEDQELINTIKKFAGIIEDANNNENNGNSSGNGGNDSGNNGSGSGNGGNDSGNNGNGSGNGGNDSGNNGNNSGNGGSNSQNNSQNGSNINSGNSNNGNTTGGNNNSTNNNTSKIPATGAAVSNYVIGGIGAI